MATSTHYSGPSLPVILGVVFVVLKLTGVVSWSWVWVLAPFWMSAALTLVVIGLLGVAWLASNQR